MDIMEKTFYLQKRLEGRTKNLGKGKYGRVLRMARKPGKEEYVKTLQITGAGLALIGALGFVIFLFWKEGLPFLGDLLGL